MACNHDHGTAERNRYLKLAPLSFLTFLVEVGTGILTGSLALITDAFHTLLDGLENLLNAFVANRARRTKDEQSLRTKGFVGSLILIGLSTAFMAREAVLRLTGDETVVLSHWAFVIAVFSLGMNLWQLQIHFSAPEEHRNITHWGQTLHILTDVGGSLAAIGGTAAAIFFGIPAADAWAAIGIVGLIWGRMTYGAYQVFTKPVRHAHQTRDQSHRH